MVRLRPLGSDFRTIEHLGGSNLSALLLCYLKPLSDLWVVSSELRLDEPVFLRAAEDRCDEEGALFAGLSSYGYLSVYLEGSGACQKSGKSSLGFITV